MFSSLPVEKHQTVIPAGHWSWLNIAEIELSADSEKEDVENVEKNWFFNGGDL